MNSREASSLPGSCHLLVRVAGNRGWTPSRTPNHRPLPTRLGLFRTYGESEALGAVPSLLRGILEVFWRLYQLRSQVFHGGVTFAKGWYRTQLRDGSRIMADTVPVILDVMDENPGSDWGRVAYPRVGDNPD